MQTCSIPHLHSVDRLTCKPHETLLTPIPHTLIPPKPVMIILLPKRINIPTPRQLPGVTRPPRNNKWILTKPTIVICTLHPPAPRRINHRIPPGLHTVRFPKVADPGDHLPSRETGTSCFEVKHAREGESVGGPAAAVRDEEACLRGAGAGVGVCVVVSPADEAGGCGGGVVCVEEGVYVCCSFGCLPGLIP